MRGVVGAIIDDPFFHKSDIFFCLKQGYFHVRVSILEFHGRNLAHYEGGKTGIRKGENEESSEVNDPSWPGFLSSSLLTYGFIQFFHHPPTEFQNSHLGYDAFSAYVGTL